MPKTVSIHFTAEELQHLYVGLLEHKARMEQINPGWVGQIVNASLCTRVEGAHHALYMRSR